MTIFSPRFPMATSDCSCVYQNSRDETPSKQLFDHFHPHMVVAYRKQAGRVKCSRPIRVVVYLYVVPPQDVCFQRAKTPCDVTSAPADAHTCPHTLWQLPCDSWPVGRGEAWHLCSSQYNGLSHAMNKYTNTECRKHPESICAWVSSKPAEALYACIRWLIVSKTHLLTSSPKTCAVPECYPMLPTFYPASLCPGH